MVDFKAIMAARKAAQAEAPVERKDPPMNKTDLLPREQDLSWLDKLAYMQDECELNGWERGFVQSNIDWLKRASSNQPSIKQASIIQRMFKDFNLLEDVGSGYLYAGYYEQTRNGASRRKEADEDEYDPDSDDGDDIPF